MAILKALVLALLCCAAVEARSPHEYDVKAAYIYRFSFFIDWPDSVFKDSKAPLTIGVVDSDGLKEALDRTLAGKKVKGRSITTRLFDGSKEPNYCHILYVSDTDRTTAKKTLDRIKGSPTLVVGEADDFLTDGGPIQFVAKDERIRFRIDNVVARRAGLRISSKLLQLAE
jgi:hypothetical protein